jgi:hypothetical protein
MVYLVTGSVEPESMHFCGTARKYEDRHLCGVEARLFEAKEQRP